MKTKLLITGRAYTKHITDCDFKYLKKKKKNYRKEVICFKDT